MKLLAHSKNGQMLKFEDTSNPKGYVWYFLAPNVQSFAKTIQDGSEVEIKTEEKNGEETITYIKKGSGGVQATASTGGKACADCGAALKDDKYDTCYNCSMKRKASGGGSSTSSPESSDRQTSIEKQAMMKAAADAVATCMQGQLDVNALGDQICVLYEKLLAKIS